MHTQQLLKKKKKKMSSTASLYRSMSNYKHGAAVAKGQEKNNLYGIYYLENKVIYEVNLQIYTE